jgi:hypothetical protein
VYGSWKGGVVYCVRHTGLEAEHTRFFKVAQSASFDTVDGSSYIASGKGTSKLASCPVACQQARSTREYVVQL